jgi:hypothetical protein
MQKVLECYYIPFNEYPYIPYGEKGIQTKTPCLLFPFDVRIEEHKRGLTRVKKLLTKGICSGKFDDALTTCVIKMDGKTYVIDKEGVVKCGNKMYYMKPGDFLWLFSFIEGQIEFLNRDRERKAKAKSVDK